MPPVANRFLSQTGALCSTERNGAAQGRLPEPEGDNGDQQAREFMTFHRADAEQCREPEDGPEGGNGGGESPQW